MKCFVFQKDNILHYKSRRIINLKRCLIFVLYISDDESKVADSTSVCSQNVDSNLMSSNTLGFKILESEYWQLSRLDQGM